MVRNINCWYFGNWRIADMHLSRIDCSSLF